MQNNVTTFYFEMIVSLLYIISRFTARTKKKLMDTTVNKITNQDYPPQSSLVISEEDKANPYRNMNPSAFI